MCKLILVVLAIVSTVPSSFAAEDTYWRAFNFSKSTPDSVIMMFGPPSTIKTEELYSDWVKTQATGCGQVHTYAMSYSIASGDLNILKGPLGKASNVSVVIEEGKLSQIIWTYDNNQLQGIRHYSHEETWRSHDGHLETKKRNNSNGRLLYRWRGCNMSGTNFSLLYPGLRRIREPCQCVDSQKYSLPLQDP